MRALPFVFALLATGLLACQKEEPIVRHLVGGRWEYTYDTVTTTWTFKDTLHMNVQSSQSSLIVQCQYTYYHDSLRIYGSGGNNYRLYFSATDAFMASYTAFVDDTTHLYFVRKY